MSDVWHKNYSELFREFVIRYDDKIDHYAAVRMSLPVKIVMVKNIRHSYGIIFEANTTKFFSNKFNSLRSYSHETF